MYPSLGGVGHVPPGWDEWAAQVGNAKYYNYTLSINGAEEEHGDDYATDYLTDVIGTKAADFLNNRNCKNDKHLSHQCEMFTLMLISIIFITISHGAEHSSSTSPIYPCPTVYE